MRPSGHRGESAAPVLLIAFFAASAAMVIALSALLRGPNDWGDFAAILLLLAFAVVLLLLQFRELGEEDPPGDDEPDGPAR